MAVRGATWPGRPGCAPDRVRARSRDDVLTEIIARVAKDLLLFVAGSLSGDGARGRSARIVAVVVNAGAHQLEKDAEGNLEDWVEWLIQKVVDGSHQIFMMVLT